MIPSTISSPIVNQNSIFYLLNNEFRNPADLYGFQLYAAQSGTIEIKVNCYWIYFKAK